MAGEKTNLIMDSSSAQRHEVHNRSLTDIYNYTNLLEVAVLKPLNLQ